MNVFVTGADFGVVRFIGTTEFAKGVWLGLELRRPSEWLVCVCVCVCVCVYVMFVALVKLYQMYFWNSC